MEIDNHNYDRAIEILNAGIKTYPWYASAYIILSRAYTKSGNPSEALKVLKTGTDLINSPSTYEYYFQEINSLQQRSLFQYEKPRVFNEEPEDSAAEPWLFGELNSDAVIETPEPPKKNVSHEEEKPFSDIENRLEEIAKGLSGVKLNEVVPSSDINYNDDKTLADSSLIISETLAKIYAAQGEIKEAIQVYRKLIKKHPHKEDYYNEKINELRRQLE